MKITLSKSQWEKIGKKANWKDTFDENGRDQYPVKGTKNKPTIAEIGREIIASSGPATHEISVLWELCVDEAVRKGYDNDELLQIFKDEIHTKTMDWQRVIETIEQRFPR